MTTDIRAQLAAIESYIAALVLAGEIERARSQAREYAILRDSLLTDAEHQAVVTAHLDVLRAQPRPKWTRASDFHAA